MASVVAAGSGLRIAPTRQSETPVLPKAAFETFAYSDWRSRPRNVSDIRPKKKGLLTPGNDVIIRRQKRQIALQYQ
jgi:hypothetical protein